MAMPASKHGDPQLGIDIHLCMVPPSPSPVPLPTPHISIVFDPFDYVPIIGGTVTVCGMKRATAGTSGIVIHIPPGFPFAPKFPDFQDELFMGSATVVADGDPFSFIAVPVLGCQIVGMPSIPRLKKKGPKKFMLLPTTFNLAIPTSVVVGGPPTISMMGLAMKGAFAALGKFAKSGLFKRVRQKLFGHLKPSFLKCAILRAEPVNIVTGEVEVEQLDFTRPGRMPIDWVRSYASGNTRVGACGRGWETPADGRLEIDATNDVVLMQYPAIGPLCFARLPLAQGADGAEIELMDGARLIDEGTEYTVHTKADRIYHFSKDLGFIREDGVHEIPLVRISDLCGNRLEFERRNGRVIAIAETAGRRVHLRYDSGRIVDIALTVLATDAAHRFVSYEYDADGDLTAVVDALGKPYAFEYLEHHLVRHTNRNGLSFYYEYDKTDAGGWRVARSWGDGNLYNYRFEYVDSLNERRITDSLGHVSVVALDERGLPISELDPLSGRTVYEYDQAGRTTAVVDPDGHRTEYAYDERGNPLRLTRPDGKSVEAEFDLANKPIAIVDANGARWEQTWDDRGLLQEQRTPLGHVSRFTYDALGQVTSFTNARGARTELTFSPQGRLAVLIDALGRQTSSAHDVLGNLTRKTDALGRETSYRYDAKGQMLEARLPSGHTITCSYDGEGNLASYRDENGALTTFEYAGLGEIATIRQADGALVRYDYDTEERLVAVTNQRGEIYRIGRDALGRIVQEIDYWGQSQAYGYTASGHIASWIDPLRRLVSYETDPLGRITRKVFPEAGRDEPPWQETYVYDQRGNVIACENPNIRVERRYDSEGRLVEERQGPDRVVMRVFDESGNCVRRETATSQDGAVITTAIEYAYDLLDQATAVSIDDETRIEFKRDGASRIVAEQLGPTLRRGLEYHADGYVTRHHLHGAIEELEDTVYGYDPAGHLVERDDRSAGSDRFWYDPLGQVIQQLSPDGTLARFVNDAAGDRFSTVVVDGSLARGAQPPLDASEDWRREGEYEGTLYAFDRAGCLTHQIGLDGDLSLRWDADRRLIESRRDGVSTRYGYDPLGRRIFKQTGDTRTEFWWDGDTLIGESLSGADGPAAASSRREYVYYPATFEPLAMIVGEGGDRQVLYYHNDPNGCPTRLFDRHGTVRWAVSYTAWAAVGATQASAIENPLRLQGQYFDHETGLHYNRYRYYDPHAGRFTSTDPIGLAGGLNVYAFAANALGWVDPLGLSCKGHFALWEHRAQNGLLKAEGEVSSGLGKPIGRRLSWAEQLETHTERKILDEIEKAKKLAHGDVITIMGTKAPCNPGGRGCQSAMQEFAEKHNVDIIYHDLTSGDIFKYPK